MKSNIDQIFLTQPFESKTVLFSFYNPPNLPCTRAVEHNTVINMKPPVYAQQQEN